MYGSRIMRKMKYANGETYKGSVALIYIRNTATESIYKSM